MTSNEQFLDAMIRHQIGLLRLSGHIRNRIFAVLKATEEDILDKVRSRLLSGDIGRAQSLLVIIRRLREPALQEMGSIWAQELGDLALAEPAFTAAAIRTVSPVQLDLLIPSNAQLRSIVTSVPFEGRILRDWARRQSAADINRISAQINIGLVQGESSAQIATRVRREFQTTRRQAESITRTAVNHISNQARRSFFESNKSIVPQELYVSTLDSRTTPICRSLDGRKYPTGTGPIPPVHFSCRSLRVGILDGEVLGRRPFNPTTEGTLVREFAQSRNLGTISKRSKLPRGTRGSFDRFSRRRIRELVGTVPARTTYQEFLTRQSAAFQNDILGPTRARLFRQGNLTLDKFVDRTGKEIPLSQLADRQSQAFIDAGLDPANF